MVPLAGWAATAGKFALAAAPLVKAGKKVPDGSFSVWDWTGYPAGFPKPEGPFRLITGGEYQEAKRLRKNANQALHRQSPAWKGQHIHEIHPIKFNGDPTGRGNKLILDPETHYEFNGFWNRIQRNAEGK